jgi:hypothetical protein
VRKSISMSLAHFLLSRKGNDLHLQ